MPWFLVPRGMAPPSDKPWLLSNVNELEEDEEEKESYTTAVLKDHPFPGRNASSKDKIAWLAALHKEYEEELEETCYNTSAPEAYEMATEVLLEEAPERIVVEIHASIKDLEAIKELDEVQHGRFASGLAKYGRDEYKGEPKWEAYKEWLLKNKEKDQDAVVIGKIECSKTEKTMDVCRTWARNIGLYDFFSTLKEVDSSAREACYKWSLMKVVGENMYYPLSDKRIGYAVQMGLEIPTDKEKASAQFRNGLEATKQATKEAGDPKTYLLVPRVKTAATERANNDSEDEEEEEPETAQNYHVLWLPAEYLEQDDRVRPHFGWGKGESRRLQQRLQKGNTDTGNIKADLFMSELEYTKQLKGWKIKFCSALALTHAATQDTYWMHDNECPDEVSKMVKDLAQYWRTTLLKKDDKTLGLGLGSMDAENAAPGQVSESREALMRLLEILGKRFEEMSTSYCKIKFNPKLGHSRNPKAPNTQNKRQKTGAK